MTLKQTIDHSIAAQYLSGITAEQSSIQKSAACAANKADWSALCLSVLLHLALAAGVLAIGNRYSDQMPQSVALQAYLVEAATNSLKQGALPKATTPIKTSSQASKPDPEPDAPKQAKLALTQKQAQAQPTFEQIATTIPTPPKLKPELGPAQKVPLSTPPTSSPTVDPVSQTKSLPEVDPNVASIDRGAATDGGESKGTGQTDQTSPNMTQPIIDAKYAQANPKPKYPSMARRLGLEGTVSLAITVGETGRALKVDVISSSGHSMLDEAAVSAISQWRFIPGTRNGRPVVQTLQTKWTYKLQN